MDSIGSGSNTGSVNAARPDIMIAPTAARPTPKPPRVSFGEVLAAGAGVAMQGATTVLGALPGSPMSAPGVRQGGSGAAPMLQVGGSNMSAEGPGMTSTNTGLSTSGMSIGTGTGTSTGGVSLGGVTVGGSSDASGGDSTSSINASLQQSAQLNLYYLQLQQQEDAQNRQFTAESNIEKTRHDTAKNAIGNVGQ